MEAKALKTVHNIDIKYGIAYFRILKKKLFWKIKKWQIENSETLEISEILEILFRFFLFPSFWFCPSAKIENLDLKISEKNFRDFRDFRGFRVFDLTYIMVEIFTIFHNYSTALSYIEKFSYNNMADCCVNKWLKVTAKVSGESLLTLNY